MAKKKRKRILAMSMVKKVNYPKGSNPAYKKLDLPYRVSEKDSFWQKAKHRKIIKAAKPLKGFSKGSAAASTLGLIGAGAAATAAWAYPAKRLGEHVGKRKIEKMPSPKMKSIPTRKKKAMTSKQRAALATKIGKKVVAKRKKKKKYKK